MIVTVYEWQIINGPKYQLLLRGSGYKPKLHCSFLQHNFGPCHIFQAGMTPANTVLVLRNDDKHPVSFDVAFDNTNHWQVGMIPQVGQLFGKECCFLAHQAAAKKSYSSSSLLSGAIIHVFLFLLALQVSASPCVLAPGQTQDISITFQPSAAETYTTVMPLRVNGLYNINIMLAGTAVKATECTHAKHCFKS